MLVNKVCFSTSFTTCVSAGIPVGLQEWRTFLSALEKGLHRSNLLRFYHLGRACLIKSETYFDAYDRVFAKTFKGVEGALGDEVSEKLLEWLDNPENFPNLSAEELAELERLSQDELMRKFLETLAEQDERHDGGGKVGRHRRTLSLRSRWSTPHRNSRWGAIEESLGDESRGKSENSKTTAQT